MKSWPLAALVGVALRGLMLLDHDPPCANDECNYLDLAERLAQGEFLGKTSPEEAMHWMWAPAYPYLLAAMEWLTGDAEWLRLVQVASFPLLAWLAWRLSGRGREGTITAWLLALSPTLAFFSVRAWSETVYVTALFGLLVALGWARKGGAARGLLPGAILGLCVLLRGVATYMLPVLLLGRLWGRFREGRAWFSSLVMVVGCAAVVAPWSAAATSHHDGFILSDRSLGQMMWLGNNTVPPASFDYNMPHVQRWEGRRHCDGQLPLLEWDRCETEAGKAWIAENPGEFIGRIPLRLGHLYNPNSLLTREVRERRRGLGPDAIAVSVLVFSVLSIVGGAVGGFARGRGWLFVTIGGLTLYQIAAVGVTAGLSRYRVPVDALWMLGCALMLASPSATLAGLKTWWRALALAGVLAVLIPLSLWFAPVSFGIEQDHDVGPGGDLPDILLISIDTLRADHLGSHGYERNTSPNLDALAQRGTRFANARSPSPWTLPSHATMLTGLLPHQHGLVDDGVVLTDQALLQERLRDNGYRTGAFVSSLFVGASFGFDRGFEVFEDYGIRSKRVNLADRVQARRQVDDVLGFFGQHPDEPVFAFLHLYDVHYPYDPPEAWDHEFDRPGNELTYRKYFHYLKKPLTDGQMTHQIAQYDEELAYVDDQLGRLFEQLAGRDVIVLVTADHGEEFGERGSWGHAHTLNPEQLHIPLIVAGPGVPVAVVEEAVGLQDVAPTLARLGGGEMVGLDLLTGPHDPDRILLGDTSRFTTNRVGVYRGGERLDWDLRTDTLELYRDPLERELVDDPEAAEALKTLMLAERGAPWTTEEPVPIDGGWAVIDGQRAETGEGTFAVIPVDADVGGWSASQPPGAETGLHYAGPVGGSAELTPEQRAALEALGYIQ